MATWALTTPATTSDVETRYPLEMMVPDNVSSSRSETVQGILDAAKVKLKNLLLEELPKRYPTTADDLTTRLLGARKRRYEQENFAGHISGEGSLVYSKGIWLDSVVGYISEDPAWFFYSGVPDSSTYASSANNGAWLINTAAHAAATRLYMNKGTLATPTWTAWTTEGLLDLILYPAYLNEPALQWFAYVAYEKMANRKDVGDLDYYEKQRDFYHKEAYRETIGCIPKLGIDKSNDGFLSDDERASTQGEAGYFA